MDSLVTTTTPVERLVAVADLGERLSALRLSDSSALSALRQSVVRHGQLSPVHAFEQGGALELFDGFKRLRVARALGLRDLRAVVDKVDVVEATVHMRELHTGRGLTALEEAWIVRALHREHALSQGAIAAMLRCHKTWVCRRLMLVEALDTTVQADVRLGLLAPRAAVEVAALPRGNQIQAASLAIRRGLTVLQTARLVHELVDAEPEAYSAVLARWSAGEPVMSRSGVRAAGGVADTISLDVARLRKSAGRLESCLVTTPLASLAPGAADLIRHDLDELGGVLVALSRAITAALTACAAPGAA
jgi:ParB-like chromosome segregation protein Spo0J